MGNPIQAVSISMTLNGKVEIRGIYEYALHILLVLHLKQVKVPKDQIYSSPILILINA